MPFNLLRTLTTIQASGQQDDDIGVILHARRREREMKRPELVTVVLPAYGVADAIGSVVRDLAVAAYALRIRGMNLERPAAQRRRAGRRSGRGSDRRGAGPAGSESSTGPPAGAGAAFLQGFREVVEEGRADLVATLDATGRHDATEIPRLVDLLIDRGLHVVIGSRWVRGSGTPGLSVGRWVLGRMANLVFRVLTGTYGIADATTSFRIARIEVVRDFDFAGQPVNSHSVQTNFVATAVARGYRVREAPIIYRAPAGGGGGLSLRDVAQFVRHLGGLRRAVNRTRTARLAPSGRTFDDEHFGAADDIEQLGTRQPLLRLGARRVPPLPARPGARSGRGNGDDHPQARRPLPGHHRDGARACGEHDRRAGVVRGPAPARERAPPDAGGLASSRRTASTPPCTSTCSSTSPTTRSSWPGRRRRCDRWCAARVRPRARVALLRSRLQGRPLSALQPATAARRWSRRRGSRSSRSRYFDVFGVVPYWVVYRLLRHNDIPTAPRCGRTTGWSCRPAGCLQRLVRHPPVGKNVILVARKP